MALITYNPEGRIMGCFLVTPLPIEEMSQRYTEENVPHLVADVTTETMHTKYVDVNTVTLQDRPSIGVEGDIRDVKPDGIDSIKFTFNASLECEVTIMFNGKLAQKVTVNDGEIELTFDHAGEYAIFIVPPFPYQDAIIILEAKDEA